jgi:hypothetical protein
LRSADEVRLVSLLAADGHSGYEIARRTDIPVSTVHYWMQEGYGRRPQQREIDLADVPPGTYAYLLGLYLGDGYIARLPRTFRLELTLDSRYPGIIDEARQALASVLVRNVVSVQNIRDRNAVKVQVHSNWLPVLFPQHGPGPKHRRPIVLVDWQQSIVEEHSDLFLRGLIQSDGCRCMNKVWGGKYAYPRYFFKQVSVDIMDLFTDACDRVGIEYRCTKPTEVSIARAASVARLDEFVGPKV